ncbi:hypothetical protein NHQ30_005762 [Ciborinia camelliae]|nr:hypothetical protein NHQ30_005762 [Ciborinia camelliae]
MILAVPSAESKAAAEIERLNPSRPLGESVASEDGEYWESGKVPQESETEESESWEPALSPESENPEPTDISDGDDLLGSQTEISEPIEKLADAARLARLDSVKYDDTGRLEIFEAGTGHGSLTLHLARAIHGANTRAPLIPRLPKTKGKVNADDDIYRYGGKFSAANDKIAAIYEEWRSQRRAVIHSLDSDDHHSRHAQRTVRNFRHGAYFPHIDFHVGSIHDYLSKRLEETNDVFLDHAILDIPGIHNEMEIVGKCMKPDGRLITWCPSITQHMKCLETVKGKKLPFVLDRVLELGSQLSTGGREWEVRSVKPRALIKAEKKKMEEKLKQLDKSETAEAVDAFLSKISNEKNAGSSADVENEPKSTEDVVETPEPESVAVNAGSGEATDLVDMTGWEMICRPRVGDRISGGGFVGVWKKMDMNV